MLAENANLLAQTLALPPSPITKPEKITFEYPMSAADYQSIRSNPYGYISYQCGANGHWQKGWLLNIEYERVKGLATITLKKQWQ